MSLRLKQYVTEVLSGFAGTSLGKNGGGGNILRYGDSVRPNKNVLDDEEGEAQQNAQDRPMAACCFIVSDDGKVLAVSRKEDPTDFGLPGGKVDPGEDPMSAAKRELAEETGLVATSLHPIYCEIDSEGYLVHTFACAVDHGEINTDETGVVKWIDPETLLQGRFADYNRGLLKTVGML